MSIFSAIECCEEAGSAKEDYSEQTGIMSASVQLRCAWGLRHILAADILGNRRLWPKTPAPFVVPSAASASIIPIMSISDGGGVVGQEIVYSHALVTVNYSNVATDLVTEAIEPTAEFITMDYRRFRWGAANGPTLSEEEAPGLLVRGINFVRTELDVSQPINPLVISLIGSVNDSQVTGSILQIPFAAETLLYAPPSITATRNSFGQWKTQIVKKFTYKPEGWNVFFRARTNSWERLYLANSGVFNSYPLAPLNGLMT